MTDSDIECRPLKTLDELLSWRPHHMPLQAASIRLRKTVRTGDDPRTLVCHDMQGGYLQDRFIQGTFVGDSYTFYHWQYIDVFIYFSHHLVTLPPPSWINSAHKNGVKVLGTFITEWEEGKTLCETFLASRDLFENVADQLVKMAAQYGFEGWLVNIENAIDKDLIPNLVDFIRYLRHALNERIPGSEVIWYDSVINTGELKWQEEVNATNKDFFAASSSFFLNYTWKAENLQQTMKAAGPRQQDVFVGVDVFGRGCYGGGGFNARQAVELARKYSFPVSLFAPGWVYETMGKARYHKSESRFWELLSPYCTVHGPKGDFLYSSFCCGQGKALYYQGQVISSKPWTNLSAQSVQATHSSAQLVAGAGHQMSINTDHAYQGGTCLSLKADFSVETRVVYKIFSCELSMEEACIVSYSARPVGCCQVSLLLVVIAADGRERVVRLGGESIKDTDELTVHSNPTLAQLNIDKQLADNWQLKSFEIDPEIAQKIIRIEIELCQGNDLAEEGQACLGLMQVVPRSKYGEFPIATITTSNVKVEKRADKGRSVDVDLSLEAIGDVDHWRVFAKRDNNLDFLGHTHTNRFIVRKLGLADNVQSLAFSAQPIGTTGFLPLLSQLSEVSVPL